MKTTKEWLQSIENEMIRDQALKYCNSECLDDEDFSLATALSGAFTWSDTEQGHDYWNDIYERIKDGETI